MKKKAVDISLVIRTIMAYFVTFCFMAPFLYMILCSFKTPLDLHAWPPRLFFTPTLQNYTRVFAEVRLMPYIVNSLIISVTVTSIALLLGVPAAYAVSRYKFRGRPLLANLFLVIQLAPAVAMILPFFVLANHFHLFNTRTALILVYLPWNIPLAVWMLRGFIATTPAAIEESGMIDGCTRFRAFLLLTVPQLTAGLMATLIFTFIGSWNEFLLAYFLTINIDAKTLPTTVDFFLTFGHYQFGPMFAAAVIGTLPVIFFALLVRKYYLTALTGGAVKG